MKDTTYLTEIKLPTGHGFDPRGAREIWSQLEQSIGQLGGSIHCAFGAPANREYDLWFAVQVPSTVQVSPTDILYRLKAVAPDAVVTVTLGEAMDRYFQGVEESLTKQIATPAGQRTR